MTDDDNPPLKPVLMNRMRPAADVLPPSIVEQLGLRQRGTQATPATPTKVSVPLAEALKGE